VVGQSGLSDSEGAEPVGRDYGASSDGKSENWLPVAFRESAIVKIVTAMGLGTAAFVAASVRLVANVLRGRSNKIKIKL